MKKHVDILFALMLIVLMILTSCSDEQKEQDTLTFAFVPGVVDDPFYYIMERGAKEKGSKVVFTTVL